MPKYITDRQISLLTYNQLGALVTKGDITIERLKSYYTPARKKAMDRTRRIEKSEFGEFEQKENFRKLRNLVTDSDLLHEIADVNRYLKLERSTISGQKRIREKMLSVAEKMKFDVTKENYVDFRRFLNWFRDSEYAASYDSDSPELVEAFEEGPSSSDWERAFDRFVERDKRMNE